MSLFTSQILLRSKNSIWKRRIYALCICSTPHVRKMSFKLASRFDGTDNNLWVEFTKLAVDTKSINLGQGFPDFMPPSHVSEAVAKVSTCGQYNFHQYTRAFGHPRLVNALAKIYSPLLKHSVDPLANILVSAGAYGSLYYSIMGLINPGDEVIIIEPFFDCYEPMVKVAGGKPVFIPLKPSKTGVKMSSAEWRLDEKEFAGKFSDKTKMIIMNTPNNPLGKVYTRDELQMIADLCIKHDVVCVSDEVYEWIVYPGREHIKIASLPDMWERTITIGSVGKTFNVTGWKLGWAVAPEALTKCLTVPHQNCVYTCSTLLQEAAAIGLEHEIELLGKDTSYFKEIIKTLIPKREFLAESLEKVGISPVIPEGGYFMMADISALNIDLPDDGSGDPYDFRFVRWMAREKQLCAIPPTAFYSAEHKHLAEKYIRFCFIKEDSTLEKAGKILSEWGH